MIELVARAAAAHPSRPAVVTHEESVDYARLLEMSYAAADALRTHGWDRFAVVEPDAVQVIALLAGASAVGAEACQYPPVPSPSAQPEEVPDLTERFGHRVVLCADGSLPAGAARVVDPSEVTGGTAAEEPLEPPQPRQPLARRPHLVLTTGTTGAPRGARHDWGRLLRGVSRVRPVDGERWLLAYGLHQFAGLQILLHVLAAGATLVAPAPRRPREGLAAMRELGVTHASATPTYWRFLLAELRGDGGPVPALRQITLGGEAIPGPLLGQLRTTFPDAAVSQIYAASEFGSSGSVRDGRAGLSVDVLARGDDADLAMKIVDGELWVRSRTGMLGYHGEPPLADPDGWRATGDLVEIVDDRIVFGGRVSEVINVGGVKVHPLPVEERVSAVPGVAMARVWARPNPMTGSIVAVDLVLDPGADPDRTKDAVRDACADLPAAARPRSIRIVDEITTLGSKIARQP